MLEPTNGGVTGPANGGGGVMSFMVRKKRFKFDVKLDVEELSNVPFVSGALFAKVRLMNGGSFADLTSSVEVADHTVRWRKNFHFTCKMVASATTGVLEQCICRVSIRKELKGGRSYQKLGYADIDLAQFAGSGRISRRYLLDGYSSKRRQDNSMLKVVVDLTLLSGDPCFKVPSMHQMEPLLIGGNDAEGGGALHAGNRGATANDDGATGDGNGRLSGIVSVYPDPASSSQINANAKDSNGSTMTTTMTQDRIGVVGHLRQVSDQSKLSSSGYASGSTIGVSTAVLAHVRQSSADAALIYRHQRSASSGSSDPGSMQPVQYASIPRLGKKTDTQLMVGERRLNMTRVNNDQLVDELMSGIDFDTDNSDGAGTLQLFVAKDGTAVLGSSTTRMLSSTSASLTAPPALLSTTSSASGMHSSDRQLFHTQFNTK